MGTVTSVDDKSTPEQISIAFFMSCLYGDLNSAEVLRTKFLSRGLDIDGFSPDGMTGLHCAAQHGNLPGVRALLECGVRNPIICNQLTLRYLRLIQASVDPLNPTGSTPLDDATWKGHLKVVQLLVSHGANVNTQTPRTIKFHNLAFAKSLITQLGIRLFHERRITAIQRWRDISSIIAQIRLWRAMKERRLWTTPANRIILKLARLLRISSLSRTKGSEKMDGDPSAS